MDVQLTFFTAGLEPWVAAGLFFTSFATSFLTMSMGIGGGALLLAIMASLVPPAALIPVHGVIQLGSNTFRAGLMRRHISWPPVAGFALGSVLGVALGSAVVIDLTPGLVLIGVGCFVIFSVLARAPQWLGQRGWLAGGVSSCLTMLFGATGPFVAVYTKALLLDRQAHVATHATFMTLQHMLKIIAFGVLGFAFVPWLGFIVVMVLMGGVGTVAGRLVLARMSDAFFQRALNVALILISLRLIWVGWTDLSG